MLDIDNIRHNVSRGIVAFAVAIPFAVSAQELSGVRINRAQAIVGQPVETVVSVAGSGNTFYCGLIVSMGDGKMQEFRVNEKDMPLKIEHQYAAPGNYAVTVEGKTIFRGLKTAPSVVLHS